MRRKEKRSEHFVFLSKKFLKKNSKLQNSFRLGRQEDAHEYLVALLDAMHEACLSRAFPRQRPSENASPLSPPPRFLRPPPPALAATTLVHALFGGVLRSQIRCLRCGHESNTYEPCVDVSLDVAADDDGGGGSGGSGGGHGRFHHHHQQPQQQHHHHNKKHKQQHFNQSFHLSSHVQAPAATTLQGALARFTAGERLEGDNAYACSGCREKNGGGNNGGGGKKKNSSSSPLRSPAVKAITLHSTPRVLVLQLKRFEYHAAGRKISRKVDFGTELDVSPFTSAAADSSAKSKKSKLEPQQQGPKNNGSKKRKAADDGDDDDDDRPPPPPASSGPHQTRYALSGVLVHSGHSVSSGHYTCFVRAGAGGAGGAGSGLWHCCDDDHVSQVSERVVLAQRAYILFYVRSEGGEGSEGEEEGERVRDGLFGNGNGNGIDFSSAPAPPPVPSLPDGEPLAAERRVSQGKAGGGGEGGGGGGGGNTKAPSPAKR